MLQVIVLIICREVENGIPQYKEILLVCTKLLPPSNTVSMHVVGISK